ASVPPSSSMQNEKIKYIVPMSLWFVANTQRRQPCGAWWACSSCPAWGGMWSTVTLLIECLLPGARRLRGGAREYRVNSRVDCGSDQRRALTSEGWTTGSGPLPALSHALRV